MWKLRQIFCFVPLRFNKRIIIGIVCSLILAWGSRDEKHFFFKMSPWRIRRSQGPRKFLIGIFFLRSVQEKCLFWFCLIDKTGGACVDECRRGDDESCARRQVGQSPPKSAALRPAKYRSLDETLETLETNKRLDFLPIPGAHDLSSTRRTDIGWLYCGI